MITLRRIKSLEEAERVFMEVEARLHRVEQLATALSETVDKLTADIEAMRATA